MSIEVYQEEAVSLLRRYKGQASVIVTDPPFGVAYHSNHYVDKNPHAPIARDWNFQIGPFLAAAADALVEGGALYLCSRWDVAPLWAQSVPPAMKFKNQVVWVKDNWSAGDLDGNFGNQYEVMMFLTKGRHLRRGHRWSNVWEFPRVPAKRLRMPAEKPVGLFQRAIEASSDPGGLVLDPFCGSGTAGEAAAACGRLAVLGDVDPLMVRMARERVGLPVDAQEPPPAPEMPACPVFGTEVPAPHLWGLHPEDVAYCLGMGRGQ